MLQKHGPDALADSELTLEDIDPLMIKCSMLLWDENKVSSMKIKIHP